MPPQNKHNPFVFLSAVNKMVRRGAFIVFEGCDRAGKTTQCKKLVEALNKESFPAEYMNFPGL